MSSQPVHHDVRADILAVKFLEVLWLLRQPRVYVDILPHPRRLYPERIFHRTDGNRIHRQRTQIAEHVIFSGVLVEWQIHRRVLKTLAVQEVWFGGAPESNGRVDGEIVDKSTDSAEEIILTLGANFQQRFGP